MLPSPSDTDLADNTGSTVTYSYINIFKVHNIIIFDVVFYALIKLW